MYPSERRSSQRSTLLIGMCGMVCTGDGWKLSSRQHEVDIYIAMVLNREGHHVQCVKGNTHIIHETSFVLYEDQ
jgi:hypothetical protein